MPFDSLMGELIDIARQNPHKTSPESFVFWSEHKADSPMCGDIFRNGLRDALLKIGYTKAKAGEYRFHDWRHYYTSYMMDKVERKLLKKQTGHKTDVMLRRYGKNNELLSVVDNSQRLKVEYHYDSVGRETLRTYGNGVRQETKYDSIGRVILIRETGTRNDLLRAEGYVYDGEGRRTHSVDEEGRITKYLYDNQSRLETVLYPWTEEKAGEDRKEAEEAGLYFTVDKGEGERYSFESGELAKLRLVLNLAGINRGNMAAGNQMIWRESYEYDLNGNLISKTTPWGKIAYIYDRENQLLKKGDIVYTYDKDGNLLSEEGLRRRAEYRYNGQNRMVYSEINDHTEKSRAIGEYRYDGLGRRTLVRDAGGDTMRTLYDGTGFDVIREGVVFSDGRFTTRYSTGIQSETNTGTGGSRYRWVGGESEEGRTRVIYEDGYRAATSRYTGISVTLYGNGEAVAVRHSGADSRSGTAYLGKDILGSVRSATNDGGSLEDRYEYDAFGKPYKGDLTTGMNLGYTGKPYDNATGLYNYGYRDYKPEAARFTTVDPIRDGTNWFAYVNNDPVNYVDPWGLNVSDNEGTALEYAEEVFRYFVDSAMIVNNFLRKEHTLLNGNNNIEITYRFSDPFIGIYNNRRDSKVGISFNSDLQFNSPTISAEMHFKQSTITASYVLNTKTFTISGAFKY
jgi:RHS repeat-associated protein